MSKEGSKDSRQVRAAGGLVVRAGDDGPELAVIHRPRYDDWSLPKGKLERDESFKQGALREVEEETGFSCKLEAELSPVRYRDRKGRRKVVRYWQMRPLKGKFEVNDEVDALRWVSPTKAGKLLDYEHDRKLVAELLDRG